MNIIRINNLIRNNNYYLYKLSCNEYCTQRLTDIPDVYRSKNVRRNWYDTWEKYKYFIPKNSSDKEPFTIILPPPNVTGTLHLGHALTTTIQDVSARWHRMKDDPVLWIPGFDHAGIATQAIVEKYLKKTKGISRYDIGKEEFLSLIWQWKSEKENTIKDQLRTMGASVDWSREYFTMSESHKVAVKEAFVTLNERDLVYRDKALINWSPSLRSAISDIEVDILSLTGKTEFNVPGYKSKITFGQLTEFSYKLRDSDEELVVATTRLETMLGDVAIAVHPDDARYARYVGSHVWHPFRKTFIPVIADSSVKMKFGTGMVKITPAHSHADYTIAKRHNLEIVDVIGEDGTMTANADFCQGLPRYIAREKILTELVNSGAFKGIKDHEMDLPVCSRSGDIIEYLLRDQWFIRCKTMADRALQVIKERSLKIDPPIHEQTWNDWLENVRDWCVSRQLWWGHSIPAYHCNDGSNSSWIVARSEEEAWLIAKKKYGTEVKLQQDSDVLDTWFSSALLPFSVMGWPDQTLDLKRYYPLTSMETGHDILFFWVARMVMLGLELTNQLPFKELLLHSVLCDGQKKKMSKTLGNVISPENIINGITLKDLNEQTQRNYETGILNKKELKRTLSINTKMFPNGIPECGVDALRLTLCANNVRNRYVSFNISECTTNNHFCNKIWQASRYVVRMTTSDPIEISEISNTFDRWILSKLSHMVEVVNNALTQKQFYVAVAAIKQFFHYEFCDFYLEATKVGFRSENSEIILSHRYTLIKCLEVSLRILAPLVPYLSDELYSILSKKLPTFLSLPSLLEAPYPMPHEFQDFRDIYLEQRMCKVLEMIGTIRSLVANVNKNLNPEVHIVCCTPEDCDLYSENLNIISIVGKAKNVKVIPECSYIKTEESVCDSIGTSCCVFLLLKDKKVLDQVKSRIERKRLESRNKSEMLTETTTTHTPLLNVCKEN